ncbi:MAG TPA: hypothetical protein VH988_05745 [Thermoanaerobaculia bacterium]|jgi:hypothetical protein|nr:hypothetical protein [Thermoanaerobaculia bacterium]
MSYFTLSFLAAADAVFTNASDVSDYSWIKIVPVVISTLALAVSGASLLITAYYQYFGKPKLRCLLSHNAKCFASYNGTLGFTTGVTIFNAGAQYGSVYRIEAELRHANKIHSAHLRWHMFVEPKNAGSTGLQFQPHDEFAGWADTLVIPNRSAVYKRVLFRSREPFELVPGRYDVYFEIFQGVEEAPSCKSATSFSISEQLAAEFLETKSDPETRVSARSITFPLGNYV